MRFVTQLSLILCILQSSKANVPTLAVNLIGSGFHRLFSLKFKFSKHIHRCNAFAENWSTLHPFRRGNRARSWSGKRCRLALSLAQINWMICDDSGRYWPTSERIHWRRTLSPINFPFQLNYFVSEKKIDIEKSSEQSKSFDVFLFGRTRTEHETIVLPIHYRYHAPDNKSFVLVNIDFPQIFLEVNNPKDATTAKSTIQTFMCSDLRHRCQWFPVEYEVSTYIPTHENRFQCLPLTSRIIRPNR